MRQKVLSIQEPKISFEVIPIPTYALALAIVL